MAESYRRFGIDRIYETSEGVATSLRRMADEIDRAVSNAKKNETSTETFRSTYLDLPHEVAHIVHWGVANADVDRPARQLRELILGLSSEHKVATAPVVARLAEFKRVWEDNPQNDSKIYSLEYMVGPEDARVEARSQIDTALLQEIIDLLNQKVS